jgi:hypothetical protein
MAFWSTSVVVAVLALPTFAFQPPDMLTPLRASIHYAVHALGFNIYGYILSITALYLLVHIALRDLRPQLRFIYHCFLRPIGTGPQKDRLDEVQWL